MPFTFVILNSELYPVTLPLFFLSLPWHCVSNHHKSGFMLVGALLGDRVRCPFHGACFNTKTGDIEEFPGLDSLPTYKVWIYTAGWHLRNQAFLLCHVPVTNSYFVTCNFPYSFMNESITYFFFFYFSCPVKVKVEGGKVYVTADVKVSHVPLRF